MHRVTCVLFILTNLATAQQGTTLLSRTPSLGRLSGAWGYTAPDGREFAAIGDQPSLWILETTDPSNPVTIGRYNAASSRWREVTGYGAHIYSVSESHSGMRVVDLTNPSVPVDRGFHSQATWSRAHTISVDPNRGHLYVNGTSGGMWILDAAANPNDPQVIAQYTGPYVHDSVIRRGRAYLSEINSGRLRILDVTNLAAINNPAATIARFSTPDNFTHSSWISRDDRLLITADEVNSSYLQAYDLTIPSVPVPLGNYRTVGYIVHNVLMIGRTGYIAHNAEGFHMVDLADPSNIDRIARYDTSPFGANAGFEGTWGVYPFTDSGVIYATDRVEGLHVIQVDVGHMNRFGAPTPGAGRTPRAELEGATPRIGASGLQLVIDGLAPNAPFALLLSAGSGSGTVFGVAVHVDVSQLGVVTSGADAQGRATVPLPVPADAGLADQRLYLQLICVDATGPQGLTASRGMWFGIAP